MTRHIHTARLQEGIPARAPAFRAAASNGPATAPGAATNRRFPRAPGARTDTDVVTPVLAPCVHIRDVPLRWYGIGGTG